MVRTFASIMGLLGTLLVLLQALLQGRGLEATAPLAIVWMLVFAIVGAIVGAIAKATVDESVRTQLKQQIQARSEAGVDSSVS